MNDTKEQEFDLIEELEMIRNGFRRCSSSPAMNAESEREREVKTKVESDREELEGDTEACII